MPVKCILPSVACSVSPSGAGVGTCPSSPSATGVVTVFSSASVYNHLNFKMLQITIIFGKIFRFNFRIP